MAQTKLGGQKLAAKAAGLSLADYLERIAAGSLRCQTCILWKVREDFGNDMYGPYGASRRCKLCSRSKNPSRAQLFKKGEPSLFKGSRHTVEACAKMSAAQIGNKKRVGKTHSPEFRALLSKIGKERTPRGEAHYAYSHGRFQRAMNTRRTPEYKEWRLAVFTRDGFTCRDCGDNRGGNLRAHHDKPVSTYPELALEVSNGVTLCHTCHEIRHYGPEGVRAPPRIKRGKPLWK